MKLLVAADGSGKLRDDALPAIADLADDVIPEVIALHVVHAASEAWSDEELKHVMAERQHRMEELVAGADFAVTVMVEALPYADELDYYIAHRARDLEADAIVVTSKRATGVMSGLLGSVAQGLLRHSSVPVLVVRPGDHDRGSKDAPR